jgi:ABC-type uncharacterized transport system permease subunit
MGPGKGPTMRGFAYTDAFPLSARLSYLPGTRVHWLTLVLGVISGAGGGVSSWPGRAWATRSGWWGKIPDAGRYAGINFTLVLSLVMLISGGLAGLAGVGEVAGIHWRLRSPSHISMGYGYTAIIVAWLARGSPVAAIFTALLFGLILPPATT